MFAKQILETKARLIFYIVKQKTTENIVAEKKSKKTEKY